MKEVSADKGYSSRKNLKLISELGAIPYIPFKKNVTGKRVKNHTLGIWGIMYNYFNEHKEEFAKHYHKRSNVESYFNIHFKTKTTFIDLNGQLKRFCPFVCHNCEENHNSH